MTFAKDRPSHMVTLRFTEKEYIQLRAQMDNVDYLSVSRYIRERVLNRQIVIKKDIVSH